MNERKRVFIRTTAALACDISIGLLFASVCVWIINVAALGIFLIFLLWLIAAMAALAASEYLIHPTVAFLLSERKLEEALRRTHGLTGVFIQFGSRAAEKLAQAATCRVATHFSPWLKRWT
ncbi:hypothetical protein [Hydrogenophaga sp. IBVHS1]|uniref:hypothetical protein n=1 Tax=unclassified Hydrogenophaga TaxID=2610897 RepID=UPI000A2E7597|nr:hypothetical protein [Hydrogenophaga sp. IBVHS1]OSZ74623.1 hypothetical protein CAP37_03955 [Hydrogenophaga sp. IBVHS1]